MLNEKCLVRVSKLIKSQYNEHIIKAFNNDECSWDMLKNLCFKNIPEDFHYKKWFEQDFILGCVLADDFFNLTIADECKLRFLENSFFRYGIILSSFKHNISEKAISFCQYIVKRFEQSPEYFLADKFESGVRGCVKFPEFITLQQALCDHTTTTMLSYSIHQRYQSLEIINILFPDNKKLFLDLVSKIPTIQLQAEIIWRPLCKFYLEHDQDYTSDVMASLFAILPNSCDDSNFVWNKKIEFVSLLYAYRILVEEYLGRKQEGIVKNIVEQLRFNLCKRQDNEFVILSLGNYFISTIKGNFDDDSIKKNNVHTKTAFEFLEMFKKIELNLSFYTIEIHNNLFETSPFEDNSKYLKEFELTGKPDKNLSNALYPLLTLSFFNVEISSDLRQYLIKCVISRSNDFPTLQRTKFPSPLAFNFANYICKKKFDLDFWIKIRTEFLVQAFYRYRYQHLRIDYFELNKLIDFYLETNISIILNLCEQEKYSDAFSIWTMCWKDYCNILKMAWQNDKNTFIPAFQYLFALRVIYLAEPLSQWDNNQILDTISCYPDIVTACYISIKRNCNDLNVIKQKEDELFDAVNAVTEQKIQEFESRCNIHNFS